MREVQFQLISEYMKAFLEARTEANQNLDEVPDQCLVGAQTRKNAAGQECVRLAAELRKIVDLDSAAVFMTGPAENQALFAALAEDEGGAIVVDGGEFYSVLARMTAPFVDRGVFTFETGRALVEAMKTVAIRCNIVSFVAPAVHTLFGSQVSDLTAAIKDLVRTTAAGDEFNAAFIAQRVYATLVNREYDSNIVTVVVTNVSEEEAKGDLAIKLYGGHCVTVDMSEKPEKSDLTAVAKKLKPFYARAAKEQLVQGANRARAAKKPASAEASPSVEDSAASNEAE